LKPEEEDGGEETGQLRFQMETVKECFQASLILSFRVLPFYLSVTERRGLTSIQKVAGNGNEGAEFSHSNQFNSSLNYFYFLLPRKFSTWFSARVVELLQDLTWRILS